MSKIILIHGINNQDNSKEKIEQAWSEALKQAATNIGLSFPEHVEFIAAFYGDVLHQETETWSDNTEASIPMSASSPDEDYVDDAVANLYLEFQQAYNITDEEVANHLEEGEDRGSSQRMAKGIHKSWLKAIARALEAILPTDGKYVARIFLKQAAAYLQKPSLKEKIDNLVKEQVFNDIAEDERIIVISHSLGTVVAYALLRLMKNNIKPQLLLTAGSPLGLNIVKDKLGNPLICLANVDSWVNASDKEDFVALKPKLTQDTFGCGEIKNIDNLDNGEEDAHSITQYLSHEVIVREVLDNL